MPMALWKVRLTVVLALLPGVARAQGDVFSSGSTSNTVRLQTQSDTFSSSCIQAQPPNIWKQLGVNPLTCHPQTMAQNSQGQCTLKGATLVAHQGTTCYYCEANNPPATLYIPMDQVENASKQGYLCGESPVDPNCMSVCSPEFPNTTSYVPPPPVTGGPPAQSPRPGPPPGPGLTPGPPLQAGAKNACQPFGPGGYDYCANPTQPAGCVCTKTQPPPPGSKSLTRLSRPVPPPPSQKKTVAPTNLPAVDRAMSACLAAKVPYLPKPTGTASWAPAQSPPQAQIFKEETAMALQAQAVHDAKYNGNEYNPADAQDYMVGWLDHCLFNAALQQDYSNNSPDDPRVQYAKYLGVPLTDHRIDMFSNGYTENTLPPLPLMEPYVPPAKP